MANGRWAGGLLFDIDGTLAETDDFHHAAFNAMLAPHGLSIDRHGYNERVMGRANAAIMADFFPVAAVAQHRARADEKEAHFRAAVAEHIRPAGGLLDLLDWAGGLGIAMALVTNAPRANAELIVGSLGLMPRFSALVVGDEIAHGKPHPLPYLEGARRIGADPARSIAFEDSRSGVMSARAAGAYVFGMATSLSAEDLIAAGAQAAIRDFADEAVRPAILARLAPG
jgi:beta-phosphoglucomutase